jgi:2-haloacid dehalogenase
MSGTCFDAVIFDLLTALLDSWTLWSCVAGSEERGRKWRAAYLLRTYQAGRYRPYETLVAEAATKVGLPSELAGSLAARYQELDPWPEVGDILAALRNEGLRLGVATNCSEALGATAVACTGVEFDVVVTAERVGYYKPDPRPYEKALAELGVTTVLVRGGLGLRSARCEQGRSADLLARPHRHAAGEKYAGAARPSPLVVPAPRPRTRGRAGHAKEA